MNWLLVCAWGDGWTGPRLSVLYTSIHLFQGLYFSLSSFKVVFTLWENYTLISFFSTWSQDQTSNKHDTNFALRRSFPLREVKSPQLSKIYWRLHSCFMHPSGKHWDALRMDEWWMLTKMRRWKLPVTGWHPASDGCNGKTTGLTGVLKSPLHIAWNSFSLKHSVESYCSSVWLIRTTLRKLINPLNFWLNINM